MWTPRRNSAVVAAGLLLAAAARAEADVTKTVHNLSASGPGAVTSARTSEVCVFCHTPHNANPSQALWNRQLPGTIYRPYSSSTLEATLNQPTGSSRLCLSCHDGTLALGLLRVPPSTGAPGLGALTGRASLGTDLSDDHPVSFVYDGRLAMRQGHLVSPESLSRRLPLDESRQLQCTTCHDPHDDSIPNFLRLENRFSALCTACHALERWADSAHATSGASWSGRGTRPWPAAGFSTVAEQGCDNCHRSHAAAHPARLLAGAQEARVCLVCHNGTVAQRNVEAEFLKPSVHPVTTSNWVHDPREDPRAMPRHVACADCHNPHEATASGPLRGVSGVDQAGMPVAVARSEAEVCFKCHGIQDQATPGAVRQDNIRNVRLEVDPNNASYHPIAAVGKSPSLPGLAAGYTPGSQIACGDCHGSDEASLRAPRPRGPHGSRFAPLLEREYQQADPVVESFQSAALCYKCHDRSQLLSGGRFPHAEHLREQGGASCAVCHDAHGSRRNAGLINFMLRDALGKTVVGPNRRGQLEFQSTSPDHGQCSLFCHGKDHAAKRF